MYIVDKEIVERILPHIEHNLSIFYCNKLGEQEIAIECDSCCETLVSFVAEEEENETE